MERSLSDAIETLIGDTPVSEQLGAALYYMAPKEHVHEEYITRSEFEHWVRQVEMLLDLVGDTSVAEQISLAMKKVN